MADMTFKKAERQYQILKAKALRREMTRAEFEQAMIDLRVQTDDGSWWQMQARNGKWLRWNGRKWVPEAPPIDIPPPPSSQPATKIRRKSTSKPKKQTKRPAARTQAKQPKVVQTPQQPKRRWWRSCFMVLGILIGLLIVVGVGGYFAVQSGQVSALQLQSRVNGEGAITIYNLADAEITVRLTQLDNADGSGDIGRETLEPFDIGGYGALVPGRYLLEFETNGPPSPQSCTLQIERGDNYSFAVVPEGITVFKERSNQNTADDLDVAVSALCQQ